MKVNRIISIALSVILMVALLCSSVSANELPMLHRSKPVHHITLTHVIPNGVPKNLCLAEGHGGIGGAGGVGGIAIGADLTAELIGNGGSADHDLDLVADTGGLGGLNDLFHVAHGGGQEGGAAYDLTVLLHGGLNEGLGRNVGTEVDDLEALALHHHLDQVLTDVVKVALHRSDAHLTLDRNAAGGEMGLQDLGAGVHSSGSYQYLGDKDLVILDFSPMMPMPASRPSLRIASAETPSSSACCTSSFTIFDLPFCRFSEMSLNILTLVSFPFEVKLICFLEERLRICHGMPKFSSFKQLLLVHLFHPWYFRILRQISRIIS